MGGGELTLALPPTGREGTHEPTRDSGDADSLKTDTMRSSTTITTDYSTLGRLRKNINELDSLIYSLEGSQTGPQAVEGQRIVEVKETVIPVKAVEKKAPPPVAAAPVSPASTTKSKKEVVFTTAQVKPEPVQAPVSPSQTSAKQSTTTVITTKRTTESRSAAASQPEVPIKEGSKWMLDVVWRACVALLLSSSRSILLYRKTEVISHYEEVIPCGVIFFSSSEENSASKQGMPSPSPLLLSLSPLHWPCYPARRYSSGYFLFPFVAPCYVDSNV